MSKPTPPEADFRDSVSPDPAHRLFIASSANSRARAIQEWLANRPTSQPLLVLAPSRLAADDLLRDAASQRGAIFGWHRATLPQLAARIAETKLADDGLAIAGALSIEALVTRLIHELQGEDALERFRDVTDGPGFARSIARTLGELRMAGLAADATSQVDRDLSLIHHKYESALREASLADKSIVYQVAIAETLRGSNADVDHAEGHLPRWTALPTAVLDPDLGTCLDRDFLAALIGGAPSSILSASKEERHADTIAQRCAMVTTVEPVSNEPGVPRLQRELFAETTADEVEPSENIRILSAPGEGRECVEIARRILALTKGGLAFDRIAVLTRSTEVYRIHIDEAFSRAGIDAWYASGSRRPHPAGRALLALLSCAAEGLSANRFAEYLSLSELPSPTQDGAPPPPDLTSYVPRDDEMSRDDRRDSHGIEDKGNDGTPVQTDEASPEGDAQETPRAPRHWERLIVDASVIGGVDRWRRRLDGLSKKLSLDRAYAEETGESDPARFDRDIAAIQSLSKFAIPLLSDLESLPHSGTWGDWLQALERLTTRAIRRPEQILAVLAELRPLEAVGPIRIDEVQRVLSRRLLETPIPPPKSRAGRVFVGSIEAARGLSFDTVFIPGLAERMFPGRILEDPILLDRSRSKLSAELDTNRTRVENERNRMRLACSAATRRLVLSYPRLDTEHARPRVPSVYALEALRAAEGRLPGFDTLSRRAETESDARIGWPAPTDGKDAIDEAEFDLAVLKTLSGGRTPTGDRKEETAAARGAARYLIGANPHLTRALRFRARRWLNKWTPADGLVRPGEAATKAMKEHQLSQRSFSPTALQLFASCPYRFYLQAIWRLSPREIPEAIEEMNPLQRGSMVHDTQFELFGQLSERGLLPVTESNLEQVLTTLDQVLEGTPGNDPNTQPIEGIRQRYKDDLAPAIERVYDDGVSSVKADLREWLRRMSVDDSGFVPWRFELSFGLRGRRDADPHSVADPVRLDSGIQLRGSIDLVERHPDGRVRVTDHKTGRVRVKPDDRVAGGEALQTTLYPLAVEKLLTDAAVDSGRLHYCTTAGGFEDREVPLDQEARDAVQSIAEVVGKALSEPFLPAAPNDRACNYCDYKVVCGPYEQQRTRQKPRGVLGLLEAVRRMR